MVNVDTTLDNLQLYLKKPITVPKLEEALSGLGFGLDDDNPKALKLDITADRPDMISTAGVARVLNAYLGHVKGFPHAEKKHSEYVVNVEKSVQPIRPFTAAMVVKNLSLTPQKLEELIYVQEKIHATFARERKKAAIGIYPLKKIKWPISFVGLPPSEIKFIPLGEQKALAAEEILEKHAAGKKYAHLLKGLPAFPLFKDHAGNVLSMPPIINSHTTGAVSAEDREVFVEVSGHYWPTVSVILDILAYLFADMKGEIYSVNVQFPGETKPRVTPELGVIQQTVDVELVNKTLGLTLTSEQISDLLARMLYRTLKSNPKQLVVETPSFRADILHAFDVIDDVARAYGFQNMSPIPVEVYTRGGVLPQTQKNEDIRSCVTGLGFQEVLTWVLTSHEHHFTAFEREETPHVKLGVTKEKGLSMVRNMLYPETIRALLANRSKRLPFRLFELDHVVEMDAHSDTGTRTRTKLCMLLGHASASFDEMKGNVESLSSFTGEKAHFSAHELAGFISGRSALVKIGKNTGILGEVHPRILSKLGIPFPLVIFECYLDE